MSSVLLTGFVDLRQLAKPTGGVCHGEIVSMAPEHDVNDKLLQCCVVYGQSPYYQTTCLGVRLVKSVLGLMMSWLNECETPGFLSNGYGCKVSYVIYMGARCPTSWMLIPNVLSHEYRCKKCSISTVGITRQMNVTHHLSCQIKL